MIRSTTQNDVSIYRNNTNIPLNKEISQGRHALNTQEANLLCLHESRLVRALYLGAGIIALILAGLGAVLPVLPTTPFVLLAAACFARGSERFHNRLLANRIAGPIIREWFTYRSMRRRVKYGVYFLMALSFGGSILFLPTIWHKIMLATIGIILTIFIWRIPVRDLDET